MNQVYLILIALISISSCKSSRETMKSSTPLFDTKWSLKKIYSGDAIQLVETKAFIRFDKEKGSAGGNGSCNSFGSNATVNGDKVNFKNIFSTKMYCEEVQQIENKYFGNLGQADRFEIKGKTLFLYHDKEKLLEFSADEQTKSTE
jgi:heat shock protein HslJ